MKKRISEWFLTLILAAELAVVLDTVSVWYGRALSVPKFGALLAAVFLLLLPVKPRLRHWCLGVLTAGAGVLLAAALCWFGVSRSVTYNAPDQGKAALYGGRKVMLLVPHQDDDINVLGGVMEEYVKYGSQVWVVFSTNGDYEGLAEVRAREALTAAEKMGIPAEKVIFLGYGDQWAQDPHLYNAQPGAVMTSHLGMTETYGTPAAEAYRPGREYTRENFLEDIEAVILEHRPDVLYCVDYDYNIDHRALSLAFEEVMGKILKEEADYRPRVFKGYAYDTAWEAVKDFYAENLLATRNAFEAPYAPKPQVYRWEDRVRLPVHGEGLSRSVLSAGAQDILASYVSQGANMRGVRIFNSDKVFWQRDTNSLLHQAEVTVSSGNGAVLTDFRLLDDDDLLTNGDLPADGFWVPGATETAGVWIPGDGEKQVVVAFREPQRVQEIRLYDHPDRRSNVLNAQIRFEDGTVVETGPLDPGGAATRIPVDKEQTSGFTVTLTQWEGEAGLSEIEAFGEEIPALPFIKLMDEGGNFAYDYWIDPSGQQDFLLYTAGMGEMTYTLEGGDARWVGEKIRIRCGEGETCTVTVTSADGLVSDSVVIRNPSQVQRRWIGFWLRAEEKVMELCDERRLHERVFVCRLWQKVPGILDRLLP